ncbi:DUF1320 domain-containing protein, partial [Prevotella sp. MGM2]
PSGDFLHSRALGLSAYILGGLADNFKVGRAGNYPVIVVGKKRHRSMD